MTGVCFPVNFTKFLRTPFLTKRLLWLLSKQLCLSDASGLLRHFTIHLSRFLAFIKRSAHANWICFETILIGSFESAIKTIKLNTDANCLLHVAVYILSDLVSNKGCAVSRYCTQSHDSRSNEP